MIISIYVQFMEKHSILVWLVRLPEMCGYEEGTPGWRAVSSTFCPTDEVEKRQVSQHSVAGTDDE